MKSWFLLLFVFPLFGTVNEPLRCELFTGYRNDRIHWHLQEPGEGGALTYSELYRDVEFWENGLALKVIHRDLSFFLRGAYGTFGKGTLTQRYANLTFTSDQPHFRFRTDGWSADGAGYFGYAVNLTADRTYKVILTPLIGYAAYFEQLKRKNPTPNPLITDTFTMTSSLPGAFRSVWYGFFFGVGLTAEPGGRLLLNAGYSYHLLRTRVHTRVENSSFSQSIKTNSTGNGGQTGWAQIDYRLSPFWRVGLGGQIHYFFTRVVDAHIQQALRSDFSEKFKLRWTTVSGWLQLSREF